MRLSIFLILISICLPLIFACSSKSDSDCSTCLSPGDDTASDDTAGACADGERRCNESDIPEECGGGEWAALDPCPRMQYCNFGECVDTLLVLPTDESPHRDLIEWWYWTGDLEDADGNVYGYELVFFYGARLIHVPAWMNHVGIVDESAGTHARKVWFDLFQPNEDPTELHIQSEDASVDRGTDMVYDIAGTAENYSYQLTLTDLKGAAQHGGNGSVRMSSRTTDSFYYSRTRMGVEGVLTRDGQDIPVTGEGWMDHQWGNFIPFELIGWDWFSIRFDDDTEIMYYVFRGDENDPSVIDMALGTYVDENGDQTILSQDEVAVTPLDQWTSDETGTKYPQNWNFRVPGLGVNVDLMTSVHNQEMPNPMWDYWEGLVHVDGQKDNAEAHGMGFVELSGYGGRPLFWRLFDVWDPAAK